MQNSDINKIIVSHVTNFMYTYMYMDMDMYMYIVLQQREPLVQYACNHNHFEQSLWKEDDNA